MVIIYITLITQLDSNYTGIYIKHNELFKISIVNGINIIKDLAMFKDINNDYEQNTNKNHEKIFIVFNLLLWKL